MKIKALKKIKRHYVVWIFFLISVILSALIILMPKQIADQICLVTKDISSARTILEIGVFFLLLISVIAFLIKYPLCHSVLLLIPVYAFCFYAYCNSVTNNASFGFLDFTSHYCTLRFFILEAELENLTLNSSVIFALIIAPFATVATLMLAFVSRFSQMIRRKAASNHIVICGLGNKGIELARELIASGKTVFAIEMDEGNKNISIAEELGVQVIIGNAQSKEVLNKVGIDKAEYLVIITGKDSVNMNVLMHASNVLREHGKRINQEDKTESTNIKSNESARKIKRLHVILHMDDPDICPILREKNVLEQVRDTIKLKVINIAEMAARDVFINKVVCNMPVEVSTGSSIKLMHYVIVGFDRYGQALALQAAKMTHLFARDNYCDLQKYINFGDEKPCNNKVQISILENDTEKINEFLNKYPAIEGLCKINLISVGKESEESGEAFGWRKSTTMDLIKDAICCKQNVQGVEYQSVVFFTMADDYTNLKDALYLSGRLKECKGCEVGLGDSKEGNQGQGNCKKCENIPFYIEMSDSEGLSQLVDEENANTSWAKRIFGFGEIDLIFSEETVLGDKYTKVARIIHQQYSGKDDFGCLSYEQQDSNCQAADHALVKFRTIGYSPVKISSDEIIRLIDEKNIAVDKNLSDDSCNAKFNLDILQDSYNETMKSSFRETAASLCNELCELIAIDPVSRDNYSSSFDALLEYFITYKNKHETAASRYDDKNDRQNKYYGSILRITDDKIDNLAEMEHARWCAEKSLIGFKYDSEDRSVKYIDNPMDALSFYYFLTEMKKAVNQVEQHVNDIGKLNELLKKIPGSFMKIKDEEGKYNINLVHWNLLHDTEKEKDRTQVKIIIQAYLKAGFLPMKEQLAVLHKKNDNPEHKALLEYYSLKHLTDNKEVESIFIEIARKYQNEWLSPVNKDTRVLILAGTCRENIGLDSGVAKAIEKELLDFDGVVISGGTNVGIPKLVGDITKKFTESNNGKRKYKLYGYLPKARTNDLYRTDSGNNPYNRFFFTENFEDYSMLEPLKYGVDIFAHGIQMQNVKMLRYRGSQISEFEQELAEEFGIEYIDLDRVSNG